MIFHTARGNRPGAQYLNTRESFKEESKMGRGNITKLETTFMLESLEIINFQGKALLLSTTDRYTPVSGSMASTMDTGRITGQTSQFTRVIF